MLWSDSSLGMLPTPLLKLNAKARASEEISSPFWDTVGLDISWDIERGWLVERTGQASSSGESMDEGSVGNETKQQNDGEEEFGTESLRDEESLCRGEKEDKGRQEASDAEGSKDDWSLCKGEEGKEEGQVLEKAIKKEEGGHHVLGGQARMVFTWPSRGSQGSEEDESMDENE